MKKVIIIGAGFSGLSAAAFMAKAGARPIYKHAWSKIPQNKNSLIRYADPGL